MHTVCFTCADRMLAEAHEHGQKFVTCPFGDNEKTAVVDAPDAQHSPACALKRNFSIVDFLSTASPSASFKLSCGLGDFF